MQFVVTLVLLFGCSSELKIKSEDYPNRSVTEKIVQSEHSVFLKQCGIKLDSCFKKCNQDFPYHYFEKAVREKCKDECADTLADKEGCYLYFRSSRDHEFRAYSTR
ncbi:hypothetical protein LFX25_06865 [Leptospira sp. FAT2]|uniref:hypothetical protein n=1 Tax=Leptospira sanjuanensis TaxID=2879643 RepID=UPI001EE7C2FE|nr:hypothetical protein [Leptospira sanjuanensis]MCG6192961.1 hypothetical protein [Leptospira sanjuanensis]